MGLYNAWRVHEGVSLCKSHYPSFEMVGVYFMSVLWLLCLVPVLCLLSLMLSYFPSLWCVVLGLYPSSSYRYSCWIADPQHPPGNPKAQLPVEAGYEYLSGCPGAALWTGKGETCSLVCSGPFSQGGCSPAWVKVMPQNIFLWLSLSATLLFRNKKETALPW